MNRIGTSARPLFTPARAFLVAGTLLGFALVVGDAPLDAAPASDDRVALDVSVSHPTAPAGQKSKTYLKVGLTGGVLDPSAERAPVNIAVVLDRSSSMSGDKIEKAKEAAALLLNHLGSEDVVSVIAYDSVVEVIVPATPVSDKDMIIARIQALQPAGSTALFAGVSKGLEEVAKFAEANRVNRVILLSDGQANVGPRSPNELARLGAAAAKRGVSITTIGLGLGYNEDLMTQLAQASDGNHAFVQDAAQLAKIFELELGDVLTVVAQEVTVKLLLDPSVRPVRVLNRDAEIRGNLIILGLNQLYSKQEKYFLVEVELPGGSDGTEIPLADVSVTYADVSAPKTGRLRQRFALAYSANPRVVQSSIDREVMVAVVEAIANERNRQAVTLRDKGKVREARALLQSNSGFLLENAQRYGSKKLESFGKANEVDADNLEERKWNRRRKTMRKRQYQLDSQQSF